MLACEGFQRRAAFRQRTPNQSVTLTVDQKVEDDQKRGSPFGKQGDPALRRVNTLRQVVE